jgi:TonB family protein
VSGGARQNAIKGNVILRAIFDAKGYVNYIRVVKGLPDGMTERAVMAARNIRFIPAIREGGFVSQYVQIEYNFNLYR